MATQDLTNDIAPVHPYRPVKLKLQDLRDSIRKAAPTVYSQAFVDNCNRNDLTSIARTLGIAVPFAPLPSAWAATTAYKLGDQVIVGGGLLRATVAGISAGTIPALPGAVGGTVVDGTVTWTRVV